MTRAKILDPTISGVNNEEREAKLEEKKAKILWLNGQKELSEVRKKKPHHAAHEVEQWQLGTWKINKMKETERKKLEMDRYSH